MKLSIRSIYIAIYLLLAAVMFVLIHFLGVHLISDSLITERKAALYEEASALSKRYFFNVRSINAFDDQTESTLRERMSSLQTMSHARYFLVDGTGRISVDSAEQNSLEGQNFNDLNPTFLDSDTYMGHLNSSYLPKESLSIIYPLSGDHDINGYLVIMTSLKELRISARHLTKSFRICFVLFFLILLFILLELYCLTLHPLRQLSLTIREYSQGHFKTKMKNLPLREYDSLTTAIHNLASSSKNAGAYQKDFVANVSHELKTPLQSIMGSAELIENGLVKPEDMPHFIKNIRTESARLVALIEDIIRLSRLDEGVEIPKTEVDLLNVATETAELLRGNAEAKNVSVKVHGKSAVVFGVDRLIYEIAYNLCENAVKYNIPGGAVDIGVDARKGKALLTVRDTGIGIPKEQQSRVFERFYRVDKSRSKDSGGTGLGLSIVKHAAAYHNAELTLESVPGKGTCVTVAFPLYDGSENAE